jgi:hypothetical protein
MKRGGGGVLFPAPASSLLLQLYERIIALTADRNMPRWPTAGDNNFIAGLHVLTFIAWRI